MNHGEVPSVLEEKQETSNSFIINLFLLSARDGSYRPVKNLKRFYPHFKIDCLQLVKDPLQQNDYICKIYFCVPTETPRVFFVLSGKGVCLNSFVYVLGYIQPPVYLKNQ